MKRRCWYLVALAVAGVSAAARYARADDAGGELFNRGVEDA